MRITKSGLATMAGAVMLLAGTMAGHAGLTDGLVAYYPFNGNANDESGNARHGTVNGATLSPDRNGNVNSAYSFDGGNDLVSASGASLSNIPQGTVAAYIYLSTYTSGVMITKGTIALTDFILTIDTSKKLIAHMGTALYLSSSNDLPLSTWTHVAITWDGSTWKLYINGVLDNSTATSAKPLDNDNILKIGAHYHSSGTMYFTGKIDDVRIYNRALSSSEVAVLGGGVAYYPFNGNANDESGNARHGTVNGATLSPDRNGNVNSAYSFDGGNDLISASGASLSNIPQGTVAAYIYLGTYTSGVMITKGTIALTDFILTTDTSKKLIAHMGTALYLSSVNDLPLSTWTHVAITWDGSTWKLYINGVLDNSTATSAKPLDNDNILKIGAHYHSSGTMYFTGKIDDVRIYKRALSSSEIAEFYSNTSVAAPTGVSASDGTYTDRVRVTWNTVTNADGYQLFRNTSDSSDGLSVYATTTTITYDDTAATVAATYYYWVKATNASGASAFSASDSGYRAAEPGAPSAPTNVAASDGAYTDKVRVSWDAVSDATAYEVWRNTSEDWASASKLSDAIAFTVADLAQGAALLRPFDFAQGYAGQAGGPFFAKATQGRQALAEASASAGSMTYDDSTAVAGTVYYYWVKAKNPSGTSGFSTADSGYVAAPGSLSAPGNVTASDGTYTNKVRIMWNAVDSATAYEVWRGNINVAAFAALLSETAGTLADDTDVIAETVYYYWVKAKNATETSAFSSSDSGYRSNLGGIQPDVKINEADGTVTMQRGVELRVAISLMTSSGIDADWWFIVATPGGNWYYYVASAGTWLSFTDIATLHPSYQGPLFDFLAPVEIIQINTSWLLTGVYVIYFGVDTTMNGILDGTLYYDSATLNLAE